MANLEFCVSLVRQVRVAAAANLLVGVYLYLCHHRACRAGSQASDPEPDGSAAQ